MDKKAHMEKQIIKIQKIKHGTIREITDEAAIEQQIHVVLEEKELFSMSCTPSNIEELVLGQLYSRDLIESAAQVENFEIILEKGVVKVTLHNTAKTQMKTDSSGKAKEQQSLSLEKVFSIAEELYNKPGSLFVETGCAHSCAIIKNDKILCQFEDIGRHNALDKVIGFALKNSIELSKCVVFTSGRISGDYLQKVLHAGIETVISRAAVTSEAIALANANKITMLGFVRKNTGNIYSVAENIHIY